MAEPAKIEQTGRVVLVGASIGKNWQFHRIGERVALPGYRFEYVGVNAFDKGPLIQDFVKGTDKPWMVLIKECASYFPGDLAHYQRQVMSWVAMLRAAGIQPVLVTVAPIAEPTEYLPRVKNFVKRLMGRPTWLDSIVQYNDWLKRYAGHEHVPVFDLEAPLRRNDNERWLRAEFDSGDGMHINLSAYQALDSAFAKFLLKQNAGSL